MMMENKVEEVVLKELRGSKSLYNIIPIGSNILIEVEFTNATIKLDDKDLVAKAVKVVGIGANVKRFELGDIIYCKPVTVNKISVIKPRENCAYFIIDEYYPEAIFTELTPYVKKNTLDLTNPTSAMIEQVKAGKQI